MANSFRVALHLEEFTAFSQLPFHPLSFIFWVEQNWDNWPTLSFLKLKISGEHPYLFLTLRLSLEGCLLDFGSNCQYYAIQSSSEIQIYQ